MEPSDADNQNVTWESSDETVAIVDENGRITAVGKGTATITVTTEDGGLTATCKVTVKQPVTGVTVDQTELKMYISDRVELKATVEPSDAENQNVKWTSDNEDVAIVDDTGKVTGKKPGGAYITVTTEEGRYTDSCKVTVLFDDVTQPSQYYYEAVYWAVEKNITQGMGPTSFNPGGFCKRYQFVLFLWRQAGYPEPPKTSIEDDPFTDVKADPNKNVYEKAVLWAYDKGITTGLNDTQFGPRNTCTRGQTVLFMYRLFK